MRKIIYISFLLFSFLSAAQAQKKVIYEDTSLLQKEETYNVPEVTEETTVVADSVTSPDNKPGQFANEEVKADTVLYRNDLVLPYDSIRNWGNLREYAYSKYLDSLLRNQKKEKPEEAPRPSGGGFLNRILSSGFVSVILWSVAILFVLFIIYRLFLAEGVFQRRSKAVDGEGAVEEEVISHESDFDALIRQSLQNSNYRQAVRYQYLRTLHLLAGKNFIELSPDKTNFQYVREISNRQYQEDFASVTLSYEYVWYGEFAIDKDIYQKIETSFIKLNQKL